MEENTQQGQIYKAEGVTPAERYLQRLCQHSFLPLWSYSGLYKNQKANATGDGKELCDLLVLFDDDVLIFSDKHCAFKDTGNLGLDWTRWFRRAIADSAQQAWRVEPFVKNFPERIFLDRACTKHFPLQFPEPGRLRLHYIVVTHGISMLVKKHFRGGSGSVVFNSALDKPGDYQNAEECRPFEVGWLDAKKPFVHVLHDYSLEVVLNTLDTITDFVEYLRAKEHLIEAFRLSGHQLVYSGEEELLAHYLLTMKDGKHGFDFPADRNVVLPGSDWEKLVDHAKFRARQEANQVSYYWDYIIERFTRVISKQYQPGAKFVHQEKALRFLAREGRVRRRMLAQEVHRMIKSTPPYGYDRRRIAIPDQPGEPYYVFLVCGRPPYVSADDYPTYRQQYLKQLCNVARAMHPEADDIVGFATDAGIDTPNVSEDLIWLDMRQWSQDDQEYWLAFQRKSGYFTQATQTRTSVVEFPDLKPYFPRPNGNERNLPCPCGSGKKWKKCHGA